MLERPGTLHLRSAKKGKLDEAVAAAAKETGWFILEHTFCMRVFWDQDNIRMIPSHTQAMIYATGLVMKTLVATACQALNYRLFGGQHSGCACLKRAKVHQKRFQNVNYSPGGLCVSLTSWTGLALYGTEAYCSIPGMWVDNTCWNLIDHFKVCCGTEHCKGLQVEVAGSVKEGRKIYKPVEAK